MKENEKKMGRRKFLTNAGITAAGVMFGSKILECSSENKYKTSHYDIMEDTMKYRKIDAHCHVNIYDHDGPEGQIEFADRLGIDKLVISKPIVRGEAPPKEFIEANDIVMKAVKKYPDRFIGQFTVNAAYQKESLAEIDRCVDMGMVGLKVYTQVKINDPLFYPIIEKMIDYKMIILMHAFCQLGLGGYRMKYDIGIAPNTSIPEDFVDIAVRYPEGMFQYAHIGGGSDWEYACKAFRDYPNIWVDTSGSNNEENIIDFALKCLGDDRLLYGSDRAYFQSVGKILASNLSETQKKKLFFDNYNNILKKAGKDIS